MGMDTEDTRELEIQNKEPVKHTNNNKRRVRKHHRRRSKLQVITWVVLAAMLVIGAVICGLIKQIPFKYRLCVIIALLIIVAITALYSFRKYQKKGRNIVSVINLIQIAICIAIGAIGFSAYQDYKILKPEAQQMKNDFSAVMDNVRNEDMDAASASLNNVKSDNAVLKDTMSHPIWKAAEKLPTVGKQIESVNTVTDVVDEASDKLMSPLIDLMRTQPFSQLKVGDDGFNVTLINSYMDFIDQSKPVLADMNTKIQGLDLSMTGQQDAIDEYKDKFSAIVTNADKYIPVFRMILGDGSDKNYLFMAQNLAEGRTNGGFPGSASVMRISNGVLTIGDFESIYDLIPGSRAPSDVAQTYQESVLFGNKMINNWDANYTPDFARASQIWSRSYESQNGEHIDGVISMTPNVIQDALKIFNTTITLSDGTELNGDNTAKALGYDLYYKYLGLNSGYWQTTGNAISDALFSETASKAEDILTSNFSVSNFDKYSQLLDKEMSEGTFLVWLEDAEKEQTAINAGISGILTDGQTQNGNTGFYWSFDSACKMGWFMDLTDAVGQPTVNEDGTYTYPVTVTMKNLITSDDIANGSGYILGEYAGRLQGQMHIFAPLGGKITDVQTDDGTHLYESEYEGLQVFYNNTTLVYPGRTMTVTYNVTLPQGVKDINMKLTPNYHNYR